MSDGGGQGSWCPVWSNVGEARWQRWHLAPTGCTSPLPLLRCWLFGGLLFFCVFCFWRFIVCCDLPQAQVVVDGPAPGDDPLDEGGEEEEEERGGQHQHHLAPPHQHPQLTPCSSTPTLVQLWCQYKVEELPWDLQDLIH